MKVKNRIKKLSGHVIICGYGRNGRQAAIELLEHEESIVVIDKNEEVIEEIRRGKEILYINGDATKDVVLKKYHVLLFLRIFVRKQLGNRILEMCRGLISLD